MLMVITLAPHVVLGYLEFVGCWFMINLARLKIVDGRAELEMFALVMEYSWTLMIQA
ncbi:hypothetical protein BVRB_6g135800 [Beta vulgaris subsp. vulgaris]|nr:hypothetical protein BVRB_6g135800 [Beta vulgaris subsp. vulgaris]